MRVMAVGDFIEVEFEDIVFGVGDFDLDGEEEFFELSAVGSFTRQKSVFDELLGNGRAASFGAVADGFMEDGFDESTDIKAKVPVKTIVFDSDGGFGEPRRNFIQGDILTIFFAVDDVEDMIIGIFVFVERITSVDDSGFSKAELICLVDWRQKPNCIDGES